MSKLTSVEAWHCALPLRHELRLGEIRYQHRDVVVVRIATSDGVQGVALGYTRGTPVLEALRTLVGSVGEADVSDPAVISRLLRRRFAPGWSSLVRAASLLDIALWDARARADEVSVDQLWEGAERDVPLMAVAGYFLDVRGREEIVEEARSFAVEGYETIKLIVPGRDLADDHRLVAEVRDALPTHVDLAIDFHGAFEDIETAVDYCRAFGEFGLRFIEDPFASFETDKIAGTAAVVSTEIAAGEDVIGASAHWALLAAGVRVLRADATASGGYSEILQSIPVAEQARAAIAPHVWPHVHHPLAVRFDAVRTVEVIPHLVGADPIDLILEEPFPIAAGRWRRPDGPGLYLPIAWSRLDSFSVGHWAQEV